MVGRREEGKGKNVDDGKGSLWERIVNGGGGRGRGR